MKDIIESLLTAALNKLIEDQIIPEGTQPRINIDRTKDKSHGDLATNLAMMLAKPAQKKPRELADLIVAALPEDSSVTKVEIAGPGFINFFLDPASQYSVIKTVLQSQREYGKSQVGAGKKVQIEYVSANPTGPLHVGHGRGAAYGATVANLLAEAGFDVHKEYYVNDAGRQMNILAASVWLRYLEEQGQNITFPSNGYKGEYIYEIACSIADSAGNAYLKTPEEVFANVPADETKDADGNVSGDKEAHIDGLIENAKTLLGEQGYSVFFDAALGSILGDIREDLAEFGVVYDEWFSERSLATNGHIDKALAKLKELGHTYEDKGAVWFKSTAFGDDKDRVVVRDNGQYTYFASDIAYHLNKFERGYDRVINIWGADHHGYIPRVKACLQALGFDQNKLDVPLVQFAILYRGGEKVQMSTRSGSFVTLRELRDEVGNDAARFFYVTRKSEQHMDFDLDLAKSQSKDNPVFYIQYAHARASSVHTKCAEEGMTWDQQQGEANLTLLESEYETDLTSKLSQYPEVVERAALQHEPHQVATYLRELANMYHTWYNNSGKVIEAEESLRNAQLTLTEAVRVVLNNGLTLLGVSAPNSM
ncbi:MAG: arginine--tRNA ligase [Pseudomonadales bacterium]|nr:arginine--tRNA ligase [Pseudomonadales bacterium]